MAVNHDIPGQVAVQLDGAATGAEPEAIPAIPPTVDLNDPMLFGALLPSQHTARFRTPRGVYVSGIKVAFDRTLATVLLVLAAPLMLALAGGVRLSMGRGVLFKQLRIGLGGEPFTILKFRTMKHSRRTRDIAVTTERRTAHKRPNDPRLTPFGRFLRKWSLDELPQLINIARGEMSFVGPRPEMETIVGKYEPWQHQRHVVRPGLTGLWQVSDRASGKLLHECTDVDIDYVESISLWTDVRIMVRTPTAALGSNRGF